MGPWPTPLGKGFNWYCNEIKQRKLLKGALTYVSLGLREFWNGASNQPNTGFGTRQYLCYWKWTCLWVSCLQFKGCSRISQPLRNWMGKLYRKPCSFLQETMHLGSCKCMQRLHQLNLWLPWFAHDQQANLTSKLEPPWWCCLTSMVMNTLLAIIF